MLALLPTRHTPCRTRSLRQKAPLVAYPMETFSFQSFSMDHLLPGFCGGRPCHFSGASVPCLPPCLRSPRTLAPSLRLEDGGPQRVSEPLCWSCLVTYGSFFWTSIPSPRLSPAPFLLSLLGPSTALLRAGARVLFHTASNAQEFPRLSLCPFPSKESVRGTSRSRGWSQQTCRVGKGGGGEGCSSFSAG